MYIKFNELYIIHILKLIDSVELSFYTNNEVYSNKIKIDENIPDKITNIDQLYDIFVKIFIFNKKDEIIDKAIDIDIIEPYEINIIKYNKIININIKIINLNKVNIFNFELKYIHLKYLGRSRQYILKDNKIEIIITNYKTFIFDALFDDMHGLTYID